MKAATVSTFIASRFGLDGGAMFGALPKSLWQRRIVPDEKNRIPLVARLMCVAIGDHCLLVDAGMGTFWSEKLADIYALSDNQRALQEEFPNLSTIVLTHLHLDHAGGVTTANEAGEAVAAVSGLEFVVSRAQKKYVQSPSVREAGSYRDCDQQIIFNAEQFGNTLRLVDDGEEVTPGVTVHQVNGHTEGMLWVKAVCDGTTYAFMSDLVPTSHHLHVPDVMGYDICPRTTVDEKQRVLSQAADEGWILVFPHDPDIAACTICRDDRNRFAVDQVVDI